MKTVLSSSIVGVLVCVLLMLLNGSFGQTSRIEMGTSNFPAIYNETISIPAIHRPWYKRFFGWFTRTQAPIQNVTYTFPSPTPPSNQVSRRDELTFPRIFLWFFFFDENRACRQTNSRWVHVV